MSNEKKVVLIGIGNCGNQVSYLAEKKYPELFDCIYVNTSESDLAMVETNSIKFKIGEKDEVEGSGKNRSRMKEYLREDIEPMLKDQRFQDTIIDKKYGFIIASAAGGTGSGAGPIMKEFLSQMFPDTHFVIVGVLPQQNASLMELGNTLEFLDELYHKLDDNTTYMMYDNDTMSDKPTTVALKSVNENIVEDIRILTGVDNYPTPYESIDSADMDSIIMTPGRVVITRLYGQAVSEKSLEDKQLDEMIIKAIKRSAHAETDRNKKVVRWGVITYFTDAVNKLYSPALNGLEEFLGTPIERFNHNAVNDKDESLNFMYLVASGLSPINDRIEKIKKRIEELKLALADAESNKCILDEEGSSYSVLTEMRKKEKRDAAPQKITINDIFSKFNS